MTRQVFTPTVTEAVKTLMKTRPLYYYNGGYDEGGGSGFFSDVTVIDEHWVLKTSYLKRDGWRAIPKLSHRMRERLRLPYVLASWLHPREGRKIYEDEHDYIVDPYARKYLSDDDAVVSIVERLYPLEEGVDFFETERKEIPYPGVQNRIACGQPCSVVVPDAIRAHRVLKRMGLLVSRGVDVNISNIMKRRNGDYVLSDPFGGQRLATGEDND